MAGGEVIAIGLLVGGDDREHAEALAEDLPHALGERIGGNARWRTELCEAEPADAAASSGELTAAVRRRLLTRGWQMGVGLTRLPLHDGHRPVATHASASHGVGLISVPALGALRRDERLREAAVEVVGGLLGERGAGSGVDADGRDRRMRERSAELSSPIDAGDSERHGLLRFTGGVVGSNLRLIAGMVRANRPMLVMARLSRSATAALGTGAYALSSSSIWTVAHQSSWPRLIGVAALAMALILGALVTAHGLWERAPEAGARERVVLFNVVTVATLAIGIATLALALFVILALAAVIVIPPSAFQKQIGVAPNVAEFARLAWVAASVAMVGGALGSLVESDEAVRDAAYLRRTSESPELS
jgi:hypothetical protein